MTFITPISVEAGIWTHWWLHLAFVHVLTRDIICCYLVAYAVANAKRAVRGIVAAVATFHGAAWNLTICKT